MDKKPLSKVAVGSFLLIPVFFILILIFNISRNAFVQILGLTLMGAVVVAILWLGFFSLWNSKGSSLLSQILATVGIVFGLLVVLTIFMLFGLWYQLNNWPSPQNYQPLNLDETIGWQTYVNSKYSFEFRYPSDWVLWDANSSIGLVIIYPRSKSEQAINKTLPSSDQISFFPVDAKYVDEVGRQSVYINNRPWLLNMPGAPFDGGTENGVEYSTPMNANYYMDASTGVSNQAILLEILSTFKFTK